MGKSVTKELYHSFRLKLKKLYGNYDDKTKRFEQFSNSEIARDLGYSDAQFSRLINETATEKEYQRAIQNIDRVLTIKKFKEKQEKFDHSSRQWMNHKIWAILTFLLLLIIIVFFLFGKDLFSSQKEKEEAHSRYYTLQWAFENSFIKPYISLNDIPADSDYISYRYQGKWELKHPYKIPLFQVKNGYHYLATTAVMYAFSKSATALEGFEYQRHEIWYDKRKWPIDSFMNNNTLNKDYLDLNFNKDSNFVKVAVVHTFFEDQFQLDSNKIKRSGKVIGRDLKFVQSQSLVSQSLSKNIISDIKHTLERISRNSLVDFSQPICCDAAAPPELNFNKVKDGDSMTFNCQLTTHRLPMHYQKTYILTDQHRFSR